MPEFPAPAPDASKAPSVGPRGPGRGPAVGPRIFPLMAGRSRASSSASYDLRGGGGGGAILAPTCPFCPPTSCHRALLLPCPSSRHVPPLRPQTLLARFKHNFKRRSPKLGRKGCMGAVCVGAAGGWAGRVLGREVRRIKGAEGSTRCKRGKRGKQRQALKCEISLLLPCVSPTFCLGDFLFAAA